MVRKVYLYTDDYELQKNKAMHMKMKNSTLKAVNS